MTKPKANKRVTKAAQILALSDKGMAPSEISKILGVKLHYIYTTRSQTKAKGLGRWHQVEMQLPQDSMPTKEQVTDFLANQGRARKKAPPTNPAINAYSLNLNPYNPNAYQPPITFIEEPKRSLFSRIKAAYVALRGA